MRKVVPALFWNDSSTVVAERIEALTWAVPASGVAPMRRAVAPAPETTMREARTRGAPLFAVEFGQGRGDADVRAADGRAATGHVHDHVLEAGPTGAHVHAQRCRPGAAGVAQDQRTQRRGIGGADGAEEPTVEGPGVRGAAARDDRPLATASLEVDERNQIEPRAAHVVDPGGPPAPGCRCPPGRESPRWPCSWCAGAPPRPASSSGGETPALRIDLGVEAVERPPRRAAIFGQGLHERCLTAGLAGCAAPRRPAPR